MINAIISLLEQKIAQTDAETKGSVKDQPNSVNDAKNTGGADDANQNKKVSKRLYMDLM